MIGIGLASHQVSLNHPRVVHLFILRKHKLHAVSLVFSFKNWFLEPLEF